MTDDTVPPACRPSAHDDHRYDQHRGEHQQHRDGRDREHVAETRQSGARPSARGRCASPHRKIRIGASSTPSTTADRNSIGTSETPGSSTIIAPITIAPGTRRRTPAPPGRPDRAPSRTRTPRTSRTRSTSGSTPAARSEAFSSPKREEGRGEPAGERLEGGGGVPASDRAAAHVDRAAVATMMKKITTIVAAADEHVDALVRGPRVRALVHDVGLDEELPPRGDGRADHGDGRQQVSTGSTAPTARADRAPPRSSRDGQGSPRSHTSRRTTPSRGRPARSGDSRRAGSAARRAPPPIGTAMYLLTWNISIAAAMPANSAAVVPRFATSSRSITDGGRAHAVPLADQRAESPCRSPSRGGRRSPG